MTPFDRSKLARIVAYGLYNGESVAAIESRLLEYAPGLNPTEIASAVQEGQQARAAGELLAGEAPELAGAALHAMEAGGPVGYQVLARFEVGEAGSGNWRSVLAHTGASPDPELLLGEIGVAVADLLAEQQYENAEMAPGTLDVVFVAPLFGG